MIAIESLYDVAARAGLPVEAIWVRNRWPMVATWVESPRLLHPRRDWVSTGYDVRFPTSRIQGLMQGNTVEIGGVADRKWECKRWWTAWSWDMNLTRL